MAGRGRSRMASSCPRLLRQPTYSSSVTQDHGEPSWVATVPEIFCSFFPIGAKCLLKKKKKKIALLMFLRPQDYLSLKPMPTRKGLSCLNSLLSQKCSLSLIFYIQNISGILGLHLISTDTWKTKCLGLRRKGRKKCLRRKDLAL